MDFFQNKNITLRHISIVTSLLLSLLFSFLIIIVFVTKNISFSFLFFIGSFLSLFCISYLVIYYFVEFFLYRKIKVLYKLITKNRKSNQARELIKSEDLWTTIVHDVDNFEKDNDKRVAQIQINEQYRREFLGNVSHELKTPIFNIQGYIDTLRESDPDDKELSKHFLNKAAENVERLNNIVHDLIQITQYETGELRLELVHFNITEIIQEIYEEVKVKAAQKKIRLQFKDGCDKIHMVKADRIKITEVLQNLILNAINYGNIGSSVSIGLYTMEKKLLVEVSDDGPGIHADHLARLFERFYRVDKHRTRSTGGTGLGLSIVKHILEAHGEQVGVRSSEGKGSTFWFTLKRPN